MECYPRKDVRTEHVISSQEDLEELLISISEAEHDEIRVQRLSQIKEMFKNA